MSYSLFTSNVTLVLRRKNDTLRKCMDFRKLNFKTKKDAFALPKRDYMLDCMAGNKYFVIVYIYEFRISSGRETGGT